MKFLLLRIIETVHYLRMSNVVRINEDFQLSNIFNIDGIKMLMITKKKLQTVENFVLQQVRILEVSM